jgi:hypothetical protein
MLVAQTVELGLRLRYLAWPRPSHGPFKYVATPKKKGKSPQQNK